MIINKRDPHIYVYILLVFIVIIFNNRKYRAQFQFERRLYDHLGFLILIQPYNYIGGRVVLRLLSDSCTSNPKSSTQIVIIILVINNPRAIGKATIHD